ncbi:MAG TPA: hypothetical protein DDZ76_12365 [Xanthomonadales bacterium]|nr:hypothetical protein [Xanthomonadales bacterium]
MTELLVLINGRLAGRASADRRGRLGFSYDHDWQNRRDAIPLSLSLPLANTHHDSDTVAAVLWGFLPDNEHVLQRWGGRQLARCDCRIGRSLPENVGRIGRQPIRVTPKRGDRCRQRVTCACNDHGRRRSADHPQQRDERASQRAAAGSASCHARSSPV